MIDPATLARLWLLIKPIKRIRERRRAAKGKVMNPDQLSSFGRSVLKGVAGALAMKAGLDAADTASLQAALEALLAGGVACIGLWLSHRKHS